MTIFNQVVAGGGTTPTGTIQITTNGTHDVTNYATADVQVPTTAPAHYIEKSVDANGKLGPVGVTSMMDLSGVKSFNTGSMAYAYYLCESITNAPNLSNVEQIYGAACLLHSFDGCTNISGYIDLNKVTQITGSSACESMFENCKEITGCGFKNLVYMSGIRGGLCGAFSGCNNFTSEVKFQSLTTLGGGVTQRIFDNCFAYTKIPSIWFYALLTPGHTNNFTDMLKGVTDCVVHFPMAIQSTIGSWASVTAGFGGTNTTVLFDLVTSLTGADSNTYTRSEKDSTTTATAWVYNDTLYYTSGVSDNTNGVNEPSVSDAIYSDAACTQSVTTITAIA